MVNNNQPFAPHSSRPCRRAAREWHVLFHRPPKRAAQWRLGFQDKKNPEREHGIFQQPNDTMEISVHGFACAQSSIDQRSWAGMGERNSPYRKDIGVFHSFYQRIRTNGPGIPYGCCQLRKVLPSSLLANILSLVLSEGSHCLSSSIPLSSYSKIGWEGDRYLYHKSSGIQRRQLEIWPSAVV